MSLTLALIASAGLLMAQGVVAQGSLEAYRERIEALSRLEALGEDGCWPCAAQALRRELDRLPPEETVTLPGGETLRLDHRWFLEIRDALADPVRQEETARAFFVRLNATNQELVSTGSSPGIDRTLLKAKLSAVLNRKEFQGYGEGGEPLLARLLRWLQKRLEKFDRSFSGTDQRLGRLLASALILGTFALLLFFLARIFLRRQRIWREEVASPPVLRRETSHELSRKALEAARAQEYRRAVGLLYHSILHHLDEVGLLTYNRARTNREHLQELSPHLQPLFARLTSTFERIWYGLEICGLQEFEAFQISSQELLKGARVP
ncbi:MAG: DUF4129 domain-containing protein [candidate division NC10 bacterium]|nr:DUF4129 domain-containing protein [candidate division NC10 bacterium]